MYSDQDMTKSRVDKPYFNCYVLDHGLSIRVNAQGLLTERNNGKRIVATSGTPGGSEQINSTLSLIYDDKVTQRVLSVDFPFRLSVNLPVGIKSLEPPPNPMKTLAGQQRAQSGHHQ